MEIGKIVIEHLLSDLEVIVIVDEVEESGDTVDVIDDGVFRDVPELQDPEGLLKDGILQNLVISTFNVHLIINPFCLKMTLKV